MATFLGYDGYPATVDVSRRIAFSFGGLLDHCQEPATRREGNPPRPVGSGVHAADDVVLTATGPGSEQFHGRIDNTRVFRYMATALGLSRDHGAAGK